jgi:hypothetical protein
MDDKSMTAQDTVANQAASEAEETIAQKNHYSGGNALLDAQVEAGTEVESPPVDQPIATDITDNRDTDDPGSAKVFTTTGDYPTDFKRLEDEGNMSIAKDSPAAE